MYSKENITQVLSGHVSPETAYLVEDYPCGFRLRCKIRYWLEFKKNHGFRLWSQTTNPTKEGEVWNKAKSSTYGELGAMFLDEEGHVKWDALSKYDSDIFEEFVSVYADAMTTPAHIEFIAGMRQAIKRRDERRAALAAA